MRITATQYYFTLAQQKKALLYLSLFHILVIASSNYLVQIPLKIFGFVTTWGALTFPFIFLATDLTVRIFDARLARRIIFVVMFPALIISSVISLLFPEGAWAGWSSLSQLNISVLRIALASFSAYVVGQVLDILVFNKLRQSRSWWAAPSASSVIGNLLDTVVFFTIAFYKSSYELMANNLQEIAIIDYSFKILISALFFLPTYGIVLNYLTKKLIDKQIDHTQANSMLSVNQADPA